VRNEFVFRVKDATYHLGRRTWIMGVINVTPDSFYDGGVFLEKDKAIAHGLDLEADGADIIDVGGESTRPGAETVPSNEELRRVVPVIAELKRRTKTLISVDTTKFEVARAALEAGADIVNDTSSFRLDTRILDVAAGCEAGFILMHMKGTPRTMQVHPSYENVLEEIRTFLAEKLEIARAYGLEPERTVLDPGIGFGKRLDDNLVLLNNLPYFASLGRPLLVGVSRKSFIGKILDVPPEGRLEGTIGAAVICVVRGAQILRVHDVKAVRRAVAVAEAILNESSNQKSGETQARYVH
jgi:dihydropteroate synthase